MSAQEFDADMQQEFMEIFAPFNEHGNGFISIRSVSTVLATLGETLSSDDLKVFKKYLFDTLSTEELQRLTQEEKKGVNSDIESFFYENGQVEFGSFINACDHYLTSLSKKPLPVEPEVEEKQDVFQSVFSFLDSNHDGFISESELKTGLVKNLEEKLTNAEIHTIYSQHAVSARGIDSADFMCMNDVV